MQSVDGQNRVLRLLSYFVAVRRTVICSEKLDECRSGNQGSIASRAHETLVVTRTILVHNQLPQVESTSELLVSREESPGTRRAARFSGDRRFLRFDMSNADTPLAIAVLPSAEERKRRERVLARLLVIELDMLLNEGHTDLAVRIETANDLIRELKFVYPETMAI